MFTRLERYLLREISVVFCLTLGFYLGLLLIGTLLARSQWLNTLPLSATFLWLVYQVPGFALLAFPLSMVLTVLMVFGRFAREHELLAMQLAGLSLARIARPIIVLAVGLVAIGLTITEWVAPYSNERTSITWWDAVNGGGRALEFLVGRELLIGKYQLRYEGYDPNRHELQTVKLESWLGLQQTVLIAQSATLKANKIQLRGYRGYTLDFSSTLPNLKVSILPSKESSRYTLVLPQTREQLIARNAGGGFEDARALSTLWQDWRAGLEPMTRDAGVGFGLKTAIPFASLVVLLLVIPVAVSAQRSVGMAFALALMFAACYYALLIVGQALGRSGVMHPLLGPWLANLICLAAGICALRLSRLR
jgi:lipopolysaccharide export system permease protein